MEPYSKPLPKPTRIDKPYWEGLSRHELLVQRCDDCRVFQWYPREMCSNCTSFSLSWTPVSPDGTLYSFTTQHHSTGFKFDKDLPYTVALVQPSGVPGLGLGGLFDNAEADPVRIGMPVEGVFVNATSEVTFLHFRPARNDPERKS